MNEATLRMRRMANIEEEVISDSSTSQMSKLETSKVDDMMSGQVSPKRKNPNKCILRVSKLNMSDRSRMLNILD